MSELDLKALRETARAVLDAKGDEWPGAISTFQDAFGALTALALIDRAEAAEAQNLAWAETATKQVVRIETAERQRDELQTMNYANFDHAETLRRERDDALAENKRLRSTLHTIAAGMTNEFPGAPDVMTATSPVHFRSSMWEWSQKVARAALAGKTEETAL